MKKTLVCLALLGCVIPAGAEAPPGWQNRYSAVGGTEVWTMPSGPITSPTEATFVAAAGGGFTATSLIAPVLADGRAVALTVYRAVTGSALLAAGSRLLGTPAGMVASAAGVAYLLAKSPSFAAWIAGDNGQNVRIGPSGLLEKKAPDLPGTYQMTSTFGHACSGTVLSEVMNCSVAGLTVQGDWVVGVGYQQVPVHWQGGSCQTQSVMVEWQTVGNFVASELRCTLLQAGGSGGWLPASMNDIAPYMTTRPPPASYPTEILTAGEKIEASALNILNPALLPEAPIFSRTIQYPKQVDHTATTVAAGNPFNLPDNTPVQEVSTESIMTGPGSITATGGASLGYDMLAPAPISLPVDKTITRTFNPATNSTTSTTTTSPHGAVVTQTYVPTTTMTSTPTTSTVSKSVSKTTITVDSVTGQPVTNTETTVETAPVAPPVAVPTDCEKFPSHIGCAEFGQPPSAEVLAKTSVPVSITSVAFAGSSSCPSPLTFSAMTGSYSVSYQPICDKLAVLRGLFVAIAGVIAAYIVITAFKV